MRVLASPVLLLFVLGLGDAHSPLSAQPQDGARSRVQRQRTAGQNPEVGERSSGPSAHDLRGANAQLTPPAAFPLEFRSIDGHGNNLRHESWGAAEIAMLRLVAPDYADGAHAPAGETRPCAREISNVVVAQSESLPNPAGASDYLWMWGQFVDHDFTETPLADPPEDFDICIPQGDPWFDPNGTGQMTMPLDRSSWEMHQGARQQINLITAFIDASNVYGSDMERALALRTLDGSGRLATSPGHLLPFNEAGLPNAGGTDPSLFLAGDVRANEQVALTAMHTLFVREHNYWTNQLAQAGIQDGEFIYQLARAVVAAEIQAITYREFLPLLLGPGALPPYAGYDENVNASIANEFAAAAFRVGHTMLSPNLMRIGADGLPIAEGHLSLAEAFFAPHELISVGVAPYLRGLCEQRAQTIDPYVIDEVRNMLFGPPGAGGFDLASLNIQRGRDHGLPPYVRVRQLAGLPPAMDFAAISADPDVQARLAAVYDSVQEIDLWVGLLSEDHVPGAVVGPTLHAIVADQFRRLRDGDRFWYEAYMTPDVVQFINAQTLATIIRRNTVAGDEIPDDVFHTE